MGAHIEIKGNLGGDPVFGKTKEGKPWVNFSVYQPHWVKKPDAVPNGPDQYIDKGGFWLQVSWFSNKAEVAAQLLKKGTAVVVSGDLHADTWVDKETGELKAGYKVTANEVTLDLRGISGVSYRQRSQGGPQPQPNIGKRDPQTAQDQLLARQANLLPVLAIGTTRTTAIPGATTCRRKILRRRSAAHSLWQTATLVHLPVRRNLRPTGM